MKKHTQLGMNPSTASGRLNKDILYSLVVKTNQNACFHCGEQMTRETFSIEHKEPWLDSEDPVKMFFDLSNISFSHRSCNYEAARRPEAQCGSETKYNKGCRCDPCKAAKAVIQKKHYTPERRLATFRRTGH
jgi:hypothetical protein